LSESFQELRVAALATEDGRFNFEIFKACVEPKILRAGAQRFVTPADAAQAGHEAIVSMLR
jgi:hypothetical protein